MCSENRPPWAQNGMGRCAHATTSRPPLSTKQTLLGILSSEKAMIIAVVEPASPTVAMAISSTARCANAGDLSLSIADHSQWPTQNDFRRKSCWNFTCGLQNEPSAMSAWGLNLKRNVFLVSFGLGLGVS